MACDSHNASGCAIQYHDSRASVFLSSPPCGVPSSMARCGLSAVHAQHPLPGPAPERLSLPLQPGRVVLVFPAVTQELVSNGAFTGVAGTSQMAASRELTSTRRQRWGPGSERCPEACWHDKGAAYRGSAPAAAALGLARCRQPPGLPAQHPHQLWAHLGTAAKSWYLQPTPTPTVRGRREPRWALENGLAFSGKVQ